MTTTNCTQLTEAFNNFKNRYPLEKQYRDLIENGILVDLEGFQEARDTLVHEFTEKAKILLSNWYKYPRQRELFIENLHFDDNGKFTLNATKLKDRTLEVGDEYDYFPSLIRRIEGSLSLGKNITSAEGLEYIHVKLSTKASALSLPVLEIASQIESETVTTIDLPSLYWIGGIILPECKTIRAPIIKEIHEDLLLGQISEIDLSSLESIWCTLRIIALPENATFRMAFQKLSSINTLIGGPAYDIFVPSEKIRQEMLDLKRKNELIIGRGEIKVVSQ